MYCHSACVKKFKFADNKLILFVHLCNCKKATLTPNFDASWERYPKKSGRCITETMKAGRDVDWTEWPLWKKSGP